MICRQTSYSPQSLAHLACYGRRGLKIFYRDNIFCLDHIHPYEDIFARWRLSLKPEHRGVLRIFFREELYPDEGILEGESFAYFLKECKKLAEQYLTKNTDIEFLSSGCTVLRWTIYSSWYYPLAFGGTGNRELWNVSDLIDMMEAGEAGEQCEKILGYDAVDKEQADREKAERDAAIVENEEGNMAVYADLEV
jgi:hypothetical protein